ncbi:hypothetical protein ACWDSF_06140 [Nocardia beijingensis]
MVSDLAGSLIALRQLAREADAERLIARTVIANLLELAYAQDDHSEYEHDHGVGDGHDQCPACWAEGIRTAIRPYIEYREAMDATDITERPNE